MAGEMSQLLGACTTTLAEDLSSVSSTHTRALTTTYASGPGNAQHSDFLEHLHTIKNKTNLIHTHSDWWECGLAG